MTTNLDPASLTEAARAIVYAYYFGSGKELDATAEHLRRLLGWYSFGDPATGDVCDCEGWDVFNEDPDTGYLGEIQACDLCRPNLGDDAAAELAAAQGYVVTLRNGCWEVDALPAPAPASLTTCGSPEAP